MKMKIVILLLGAISVFNVNAGLGSMALKGGTSYAAYSGFRFAVEKGGVIATKAGLKAVKSYIKKNPDKVVALSAAMTAYAVEHKEMTSKAVSFMAQAGLISSSDGNQILEDSREYATAHAAVESQLGGISNNDGCSLSYLNSVVSGDLTGFMNNGSKPVKVNDTGSYAYLKRMEEVGDNLEHDHIPSQKAVRSFLEKKLGQKFSKTSREYKKITNNASAIEITKLLHSKGRTYRGKNTPIKIKLDAMNLRDATIKDFSYHYMNSGFDWSLMKSFVNVYKRNTALCLYSR